MRSWLDERPGLRVAQTFEVAPYRFRPFVRDDLPMVAGWLWAPEVVAWWGDPDEQRDVVAEDLDEPLMRQWIVAHREKPFAYLQAYPAKAWSQAHMMHLPGGAVALDTFIGEPDQLGRGHGGAYLRAAAAFLVAEGAALVAIDPQAYNLRARRAYARAGFVGDEVVTTADGDVVIMVWRDREQGEPGRA